MLVDTHCHIHDPSFPSHSGLDPESNQKQLLARAHTNDIQKIIVIGTSEKDNLIAQNFAGAHNGVYWSYGYHPNEKYSPPSLQEKPQKLVAIGEIGLDYHYQPFDRVVQIKHFEEYIGLAKRLDLPCIFHVRESFEDFWSIIDNAHVKKAVLHSFSDTQTNLEIALAHNFYIGVGGLVTFAKIPIPPLESIILETDAPYLTPQPFRGKINEPSYIKNIAEWVAGHLRVPLETVATQTTRNATKLFKL